MVEARQEATARGWLAYDGSTLLVHPAIEVHRLVFAKALPFLAIAAALFGAIFVYVGYQSAAGGAPGWGIGIGLFGLLGVALAVFLWRLGSRLGEPASRPSSGEG